ncbi:MAG: enoyl-CoA hydratase-related protein [Candidatus Binataceae bacterium]
MTEYKFIEVDEPEAAIRRISLNRPEKRNALSNPLRAELFDALRKADADPAIGAIIIRGNGKCFSAGYDLSQSPNEPLPRVVSPGEGVWPRHLVDGWFEMWDMATPIIAQVHGYCLAGGTELATACDLVYVAEDAQIGYPPVRAMSSPDCAYHPWLMGMRNAMEMMLTGDSITGIEAARMGFANRAFAADELAAEVLNVARRVARIPRDLQALNKRVVHRAMEIMGARAAIRSATEIQALCFHQASSREYMAAMRKDVKKALDQRDSRFGDYRTAERAKE